MSNPNGSPVAQDEEMQRCRRRHRCISSSCATGDPFGFDINN